MRLPLKSKKAFTMVEVLFVIVVIGLLVLLILPRISTISNKARESGVKNDMHSYQSSAETYLREGVGNAPSESGLNSYLDKKMQFNTGFSSTSDPWGNPYRSQIRIISSSEAMIGVRSPGPDGQSSSLTDLFSMTATNVDKDDTLMVAYFHNGQVMSCTYGFSNNLNQVITAPSAPGTVDYEIPWSLRQPKTVAYAYEYAVDVKDLATQKIYRTFVYSNTPLQLYSYSFPPYDMLSERNSKRTPMFLPWNVYRDPTTGFVWTAFDRLDAPVFQNIAGTALGASNAQFIRYQSVSSTGSGEIIGCQ